MMRTTDPCQTHYSVRFELSAEPGAGTRDFVTRIGGVVLARPLERGEGASRGDQLLGAQPVGRIRADLVHLDLALAYDDEDDVVSLPQRFADADEELVRYAGLFDADGEPTPAVRAVALGDSADDEVPRRRRRRLDPDAASLLVIRHLELGHEHRGQRLGHRVVARTIRMFAAPRGLVALRAVPPQHAELFRHVDAGPVAALARVKHRIPCDSLVDDPFTLVEAHLAARRLRRYFARLGFVKLPESDVMVLGRSGGSWSI